MRAKLTKRNVDAVEVGSTDGFLWDTEVRGFGLKVTPQGRRVYLLQTRLGGRLRRFTIGPHGSPWTPDQARLEALRMLGDVARRVDPHHERKRSDEVTIADLCDLYLAEGCAGKKSSTVVQDRSRIERHIKPLLGTKSLSALTQGDLEQFMTDIARGRTAVDQKTRKQGRAIVTGGKGTATRVMGMMGSMLNFAVRRGMRADNPAIGIKRFPDRKLERFLSTEELARLSASFTSAEARGDNPFALAAVRLLALTGARKGEILNLKWEWVDFERSCLRLPDSKTGAKVVPLGSPALEVLTSLPRFSNNPHVIAGSSPGRAFVGLQKVWTRIRSEAGMPRLRLHDLRHHFISTGASRGESLYVLGKVAGHKQASTTQRYAHLGDDPVRQTTERVSIAIQHSLRQQSSDGGNERIP